LECPEQQIELSLKLCDSSELNAQFPLGTGEALLNGFQCSLCSRSNRGKDVWR